MSRLQGRYQITSVFSYNHSNVQITVGECNDQLYQMLLRSEKKFNKNAFFVTNGFIEIL